MAYCNIGNPQQFGQKPLTFVREVMASVIDPNLIKKGVYNEDVSKRAQKYIDVVGSMGAYTASLGIPYIRNNVANFISKTYGVPVPHIKNIFLT